MLPDTPWKRMQAGRRARKSEEQGAKLEGGTRVPMSGAGRQKGDIRSGQFLIEDKYTDDASYTIKESDLKKISAHAMSAHRLWQLRITLPNFRLRVLREEDYLALQAQASRED